MFTGFFSGGLKGLYYAFFLIVACAIITAKLDNVDLAISIYLAVIGLSVLVILASWLLTIDNELTKERESKLILGAWNQIDAPSDSRPQIYSRLRSIPVLIAGYANLILWVFIIAFLGGVLENILPGQQYVGLAALGLAIAVGVALGFYSERVYPKPKV